MNNHVGNKMLNRIAANNGVAIEPIQHYRISRYPITGEKVGPQWIIRLKTPMQVCPTEQLKTIWRYETDQFKTLLIGILNNLIYDVTVEEDSKGPFVVIQKEIAKREEL